MSKGNRDEAFLEIQKGDKVYYFNAQLQEHSGKAVMVGPEGWVVSCEHGPVVVQEGNNYAGHTPGKDREPDWLGKFLNQPYFGK
jgi:hypothetical protein|tara:strand:- start:58 stop:309 length:252 start_codon:yes stop_codon:yes gene_type:complete